jgi:outer membrane protein, heavy metal efflux system
MKTKWLLSFLVTTTFVFATTVEELVQITFEKNYTLQGLEKAISGANENISLAKKWENPMLDFGVNDIALEKTKKVDREQFVGVTQVIPMGNKLEYKQNIALKDKAILDLTLEDKKLELQSKIYELGFSIALLQKRAVLFENYLSNIKKLQQLNTALYENNQALQTQVLSSQILYTKVNLQKIKLNNTIKNLYAQLEELTQEKIDTLDINLEQYKKALSVNYEQHPKLKIQELLSQQALTQAKLEAENKIPDISLSLMYVQKQMEYEDYVNISVAIPLAIYGTENSKVIQARAKNHEELSRLNTLEKEFKTQTELLKNEFDSSLESIKLLENTLLPIQRKMQEAFELYNSLEKAKLEEVISSLNEYIEYEFLLLDEQLVYFQTLAKAIYYNKGNLQ